MGVTVGLPACWGAPFYSDAVGVGKMDAAALRDGEQREGERGVMDALFPDDGAGLEGANVDASDPVTDAGAALDVMDAPFMNDGDAYTATDAPLLDDGGAMEAGAAMDAPFPSDGATFDVIMDAPLPDDGATARDGACMPQPPSSATPSGACSTHDPISTPDHYAQIQEPFSTWGCLPESTPEPCRCAGMFTCECLRKYKGCVMFPGFPDVPQWAGCDESTGIPTVTCK